MIIDKIDKRERKRKDVEWFRDASDKVSAIQLALTPCSVPNDPRCAPGNTQVKDALNTIRELRTMISEEIARRGSPLILCDVVVETYKTHAE